MSSTPSSAGEEGRKREMARAPRGRSEVPLWELGQVRVRAQVIRAPPLDFHALLVPKRQPPPHHMPARAALSSRSLAECSFDEVRAHANPAYPGLLFIGAPKRNALTACGKPPNALSVSTGEYGRMPSSALETIIACPLTDSLPPDGTRRDARPALDRCRPDCQRAPLGPPRLLGPVAVHGICGGYGGLGAFSTRERVLPPWLHLAGSLTFTKQVGTG